MGSEFVAKHSSPSELSERFNVTDVASTATNAFFAQDKLAQGWIVVDVFGGATGHVNGRKDTLVKLIVDLCAEGFKSSNNFKLSFCDFSFLLRHISVHSLVVYLYLEAYLFEQA